MKKILAAIFTIVASSSAMASELTGRVTFESGLYTYSYELSASDTPVTEVLVLVNSIGGDFDIHPVAGTSPNDWQLATYVGVNPNNNGFGATYFGWGNISNMIVGPITGFSFTTTAPPASQPVPITYMLYSPLYHGGPGILESFYLGSVVAPDFLIPEAVPEPETYAMLLAGLGLVGFAARRKRMAA
jgi:hypothetical protein